MNCNQISTSNKLQNRLNSKKLFRFNFRRKYILAKYRKRGRFLDCLAQNNKKITVRQTTLIKRHAALFGLVVLSRRLGIDISLAHHKNQRVMSFLEKLGHQTPKCKLNSRLPPPSGMWHGARMCKERQLLFGTSAVLQRLKVLNSNTA
jgi:hypothetical protein